MDFFESVNKGLSRKEVFNYRTRASRSEYWWFYLFNFLLSITSEILYPSGEVSPIIPMPLYILFFIFMLYVVLATISLGARRLHDIDKSGWWLLIPFTIIGIPILIYWLCQKGNDDENRFGSNPLELHSGSSNTKTTTPSKLKRNPYLEAMSENNSNETSNISSNESEPEDSGVEQELKRIESMFKESLISEEERNAMRRKILGID